MKYRFGTESDLDFLAEWNYQLISDEGHRNSMSMCQLRERMNGWVESEYKVVIFSNASGPVSYTLYRENDQNIYLRQLFVKRECRRQGIGREAIGILREQIWPPDKRLTTEVLTANAPAIAFWRSVGYSDYCLTLEIIPKEIG